MHSGRGGAASVLGEVNMRGGGLSGKIRARMESAGVLGKRFRVQQPTTPFSSRSARDSSLKGTAGGKWGWGRTFGREEYFV